MTPLHRGQDMSPRGVGFQHQMYRNLMAWIFVCGRKGCNTSWNQTASATKRPRIEVCLCHLVELNCHSDYWLCEGGYNRLQTAESQIGRYWWCRWYTVERGEGREMFRGGLQMLQGARKHSLVCKLWTFLHVSVYRINSNYDNSNVYYSSWWHQSKSVELLMSSQSWSYIREVMPGLRYPCRMQFDLDAGRLYVADNKCENGEWISGHVTVYSAWILDNFWCEWRWWIYYHVQASLAVSSHIA
jgi:hypothetical protein